MSEKTICPNCSTPIKSGIMSSVKLLSEEKISIINIFDANKATGYCNKCGNTLFEAAKNGIIAEKQSLMNEILNLLQFIPVISTHSPLNWDYRVLRMVTGQSTTGTGVISEFTSSFTDLFGMQSGRYNKKIKSGELMCFNQLRMQTIDMGGNAVTATDIDYSELGGDKGMIMVCMAGTSVELKNLKVLGEEAEIKIKELFDKKLRLKQLNNINLELY
jgi:uncharacterized protein YbjQ (UPF0145 family)